MRVAIFQNSQKHSEVFGFIMEFCKHHDIILDIYIVKYGFWYGPYFNSIFNTHYRDFNPNTITPNIMKKYDFVFVTTANNIKSIRGVKKDNIFFIHHIPAKNYSNGKHICLTPLVQDCIYLFPVYNGCSVIKYKENIFSIIGHLGSRNIRDLAHLLHHPKYKDKKFKIYVFTRSKFTPKDKRITVFPFCKTELMIKKLKECKFLLSIPKPNSYYYKDRISGELPLAYSHNIPICMPTRLNKIYNLTGTICYEKTLVTVFHKLLNITKQPYLQLINKLQRQRDKVIQRNHRQLRKHMKIKHNKKFNKR